MLRSTLLAIIVLISSLSSLLAQETTATIGGTVQDDKETPIAGASIIVTHEPTAYSTGTQSNSKGIFVIPNLKPGGPYTIKISFVGFQTQTLDNVNLALGNNPDLKIALLPGEKSLSEVVVVGAK